MSGSIAIRLRVPLKLKTRDQRILEAATGQQLPPYVIPARTTLKVVDFFTSGAYALDRDGAHVLISPETLRQHAYMPRVPVTR